MQWTKNQRGQNIIYAANKWNKDKSEQMKNANLAT